MRISREGIFAWINSGHERSVKAKKNILALTLLKGLSILIGLLLVPLTIDYVDADTYGVWLTISSIVAWISFFDVGISNGLKNRLTQAWAKEDIDLAKQYVSTTYAMLILIFVPLCILFLIINCFVDWSGLLNIQSTKASGSLNVAMSIVFAYFCLRFILSTINIVLLADQRPAESSFRQLCEQILSLLIIYILIKTTEGSLLNLCYALCIAPLFLLMIFSVLLYRKRYKGISPSIKKVQFSLLPQLFNLGFKFFIVQIAGIIQFQTSNFIIINNWGAKDVTSYNIAFKYFSILSMAMAVFIAPLWAATTEAYTREDYLWIKNAVRKYKKIFYFLFCGGILMVLCSEHIYALWIGSGKITIGYELSLCMFLYVSILMYGSIFVNILNGIGAIKIQYITCLISPFVFIGITYILIKYTEIGIPSVLIGAMLANVNGLILAPLQYKKIFEHRKAGIWLK